MSPEHTDCPDDCECWKCTSTPVDCGQICSPGDRRCFPCRCGPNRKAGVTQTAFCKAIRKKLYAKGANQ